MSIFGGPWPNDPGLSGGGGAGSLLAANNLSDVASASTSRVNLGLVAQAPTGVAATDTATVIAAAINYIPLNDGNYVCTATGLQFANNQAAAIFSKNGSAKTSISLPAAGFDVANVKFSGSIAGPSQFNLTVQANRNDATLTIAPADAVSLAAQPGDYLHLWSDKLIPATDANGAVQGEIVRVASVNTGTGVITLDGFIGDTFPYQGYTLANTSRLRKLNLLDGCYVKGIKFINSAPLTGGSQFVEAERTNNFWMDDVQFINNDGPSVQMTDSVNFQLRYKVKDSANDPGNSRFGYGALMWGASRTGRVEVDAEKCRHAFTTGADTLSGHATDPEHCGVPRDIRVFGAARETTDVGWDTHSQGENITFCDITAVGCQGPFQARAPGVKLLKWTFENCRDSGYIFWTAAGFRCMPGTSHGCVTGNAAIFRVGDSTGNILQDCKFFGLHSDADGHMAVLLNCNDIEFFAPTITNPTSGTAFINSGGVTNCNIIFPVTDGVTNLLSSATGITTYSPPGNTPINITTSPYSAKGDYKTVTDAAITTGTPTLTSATAAFTAADTGKTYMVAGAGTAGAYLQATGTFVNATTITLASNAATTVSGATMSYATNNKAAINTAIASGATTVYVPNGGFWSDMSASAFSLADGHLFMGDGWNSQLIFGPEGATTTLNFFVSSSANVRFEKLRLVGPQSIGTGGTVFGLSMSGAGGSVTVKDTNFRLFSFALSSSAAGSSMDVSLHSEIEGRTTGGANCVAINHTGGGGEIKVHDTFIWNCGLGNNPFVSLTTGTALDIDRSKLDNGTGTGAVVSHTDSSGPTPAAYSRVTSTYFGPSLTGTNIRTPYQVHMKITDCDFTAPIRHINFQGPCTIDNCRWNLANGAANLNLIDCTVGFSGLPSLIMTACRVEGPTATAATTMYIVNFTSDAEAEIFGNTFLLGSAGQSVGGVILIGTSIGATHRIAIYENKIGGNTNNNYAIKTGSGITEFTGNRIFGTFAGGVFASEGGTPAAVYVDGNEFNQATNQPNIKFTTTPTKVFIGPNNYGDASGTGPGAGYIQTNASVTQALTDTRVGVTSTAAARTYTSLAGGQQTKGKVITVLDESNAAATNNITVATNGTDTFIGGGTTKVINTNGGKISYYWNGSNFALA